ncbi:MAG: alkylphosphonate utilization protein [Rhodobacteraceae bacterium]|nr:alkylphosphonate utilization protein [Paracoccaceae bacterium]
MSIRFVNATTLRENELQNRSVAVEDGCISKGPHPEVDLEGYYVLPGIIDLHGDAFERHIAPRPRAPFDIRSALRGVDVELAANGVTTAWMAHSWSWEGGRRSPEHAIKFANALRAYRKDARTNMRIQLRCETHTTDTYDDLIKYIKDFGIDYVIFNNHLPEAQDIIAQDMDAFGAWAAQVGKTSDEHLACVRAAEAQQARVQDMREYYALLGAKICEFPTTVDAAKTAKQINNPVLMGAPNIVRGGSQSGNVSAIDLVRADLCDALVSDYYYPALSQAATQLWQTGELSLPKAWNLISKNPAAIMGKASIGSIDYGMRADLVIMNKETLQIEATLCDGRIAYASGEAANRLFKASTNKPAIAAE